MLYGGGSEVFCLLNCSTAEMEVFRRANANLDKLSGRHDEVRYLGTEIHEVAELADKSS